MTKQQLANILTFSGGVPFVGLSLALAFAFAEPSLLSYLLFTYAAIIVSFMAGVHWGAYLFQCAPLNLFIHSNVLALLAWSSLFLPTFFAYPLLIVCFAYLLLIDRQLFKEGIVLAWYWQLRVRITSIVILSLLAAWIISG